MQDITMIRYGFAVLLGALLFAPSGAAQNTGNAPDEAGLRGLNARIDEYAAAYNTGDVDRVMSYWVENADFVLSGNRRGEVSELERLQTGERLEPQDRAQPRLGFD